MRKTTPDYSKRQAEYQHNRRAKRKAEGLCVDCGKRPPDNVIFKGKQVVTCTSCREKTRLRTAKHAAKQAQKDNKTHRGKRKDARVPDSPMHGKPHPFTTTGKRYMVKKTGNVGTIMPCPCPDPIILNIKRRGGGWSVHHLKECRELIAPEQLYAIVPILQYLKKITQKEVL